MPQNSYIKVYGKRQGIKSLKIWEKNHIHHGFPLRRYKRYQSVNGINGILGAKKNTYLKSHINSFENQKIQQKNTGSIFRQPVPVYLLGREEIINNESSKETSTKCNFESIKRTQFTLARTPNNNELLTVWGSSRGSKKLWMRKVTGITFMKPNFVRPPPQYERFIRPMSLRLIYANVTHVQSGKTFLANILNLEMNPMGYMHTTLGKISVGSIIRVEVKNLFTNCNSTALVSRCTYAQVTNEPSHDGIINSVLISN